MSSEKESSIWERKTSRRELLKVAGKGAVGLAVSATLLGLVGCGDQGMALPTAMLVADASRCTGCGRCEIVCSTRAGKPAAKDGTITYNPVVQPSISGIQVSRHYNFGVDGPKLAYRYENGQYGNLSMSPVVCRQCKEAFCAAACPEGAITADKKTGARVVNADVCTGCGACVEACLWNSILLNPQNEKAFKCTNCGACVDSCPTGALSLAEWKEVFGA